MITTKRESVSVACLCPAEQQDQSMYKAAIIAEVDRALKGVTGKVMRSGVHARPHERYPDFIVLEETVEYDEVVTEPQPEGM